MKNNEKKGRLNLDKIKKIAKETKNEELAADVEKRIKNRNTVNK